MERLIWFCVSIFALFAIYIFICALRIERDRKKALKNYSDYIKRQQAKHQGAQRDESTTESNG